MGATQLPRHITEDGRCPSCGCDLLDAEAQVTWRGTEYGKGWLERDDDGTLYYAGKSSPYYSDIDGFACGQCGQALLLPDDIDFDWA